MIKTKFKGKSAASMPRWWQRTTLVVFGNQCVYCDAKGIPLTWDHAVPQRDGGSNGVENALPACYDCNHKKAAKTLAQFVHDERRLRHIQEQLATLDFLYGEAA